MRCARQCRLRLINPRHHIGRYIFEVLYSDDFAQQVSVIKASALYMPLMQHESLISLIATRSLCEGLKTRCTNEEEHKWVDMATVASKRHMDMLVMFGRYPTRNAILGRTSTEAEENFLRDRKVTL